MVHDFSKATFNQEIDAVWLFKTSTPGKTSEMPDLFKKKKNKRESRLSAEAMRKPSQYPLPLPFRFSAEEKQWTDRHLLKLNDIRAVWAGPALALG